MKRKRPSRHYRNVKTKKGRKKVLVNPKIKKCRVKKKKHFGYVPRMPKAHEEQKVIPIEEKPIHSLTEEEFLTLVNRGNYGFSPNPNYDRNPERHEDDEDRNNKTWFGDDEYDEYRDWYDEYRDWYEAKKLISKGNRILFGTGISSKKKKKKNFGYLPAYVEPWDRGDTEFYKNLQSQIRKLQNKRMELANDPKAIRDQTHSAQINDLDNEINRKFGVLSSMAARRDKALPLQKDEKKRIEMLNANFLKGATSAPTRSTKRQEKRNAKLEEATKQWREVQNLGGGKTIEEIAKRRLEQNIKR